MALSATGVIYSLFYDRVDGSIAGKPIMGGKCGSLSVGLLFANNDHAPPIPAGYPDNGVHTRVST